MGNYHLQRGEVEEAETRFRRAQALAPLAPSPVRALAVTLMEVNRLESAEHLLRQAIRKMEPFKRWRLHLTLCQLLLKQGDEGDVEAYYEEALEEAGAAIRLAPRHASGYFYHGVAHFKLEDVSAALHDFRTCLQKDPYCTEAEVNLKRILKRERQGRRQFRSHTLERWVLGTVLIAQLGSLWFFRLQSARQIALNAKGEVVETGMLTGTVFMTLLMFILAALLLTLLLPALRKFKMSGLEAEINAPDPKTLLNSGPKGEIKTVLEPPALQG
jgi:tetratricopeptide (TPR) repeat protein